MESAGECGERIRTPAGPITSLPVRRLTSHPVRLHFLERKAVAGEVHDKELYVSSNPHETRVALVEDDQLAEIFYERENEYTLAGSIYKGRVTRVLPGMQSAFVDIGLERDAFLYVSDFLDLQDEEDEDFEVAVKTNGASDNTQRQDRGERPERSEHRRDHRNDRGERNEQPRREREDEPRRGESAAAHRRV